MSISESERSVFKECPLCGSRWESRDDFISDPEIKIVGYQPNFEELTAGYFVFNHACETSLAITVDNFRDLYDGPVFAERKTGGPDCLGYCMHERELRRCTARCECAFVREIIQVVRNWPKNASEHTASARP